MNKKELCESSLSIAYYSGFNGLEIKSTIHEKAKEIYAIFLILVTERKSITD